MTDIDNGGCGCHAAEANPAQSASEQPAEADGHSDISDGREDLGLRGAR